MRSKTNHVGFVLISLALGFVLAPSAEAGVSVYTTSGATLLRANVPMEISAVVTDSTGVRQGGVAVNWSVNPGIAGIAFNPTLTDINDINGRTRNTLLPQGNAGDITITADAGIHGAGATGLTLLSTTLPCPLGVDGFDLDWESDHPCNMKYWDATASFSDEINQAIPAWNSARCSDNLPHVGFLIGTLLRDITIQQECIPRTG